MFPAVVVTLVLGGRHVPVLIDVKGPRVSEYITLTTKNRSSRGVRSARSQHCSCIASQKKWPGIVNLIEHYV